MGGVLEGIRVAAVGVDESGELCGELLAELGAEVVVEEAGESEGFDVQLEGPGAPAALRGRELGPGSIRCRLTPFGDRGPRAGEPGSELTVQALAGLMTVSGYPGEPPTRIGPPVFAHVAALFGLIGVLAALEERDRSGAGQDVEVAAFDCAVAYLAPYVPLCLVDGANPGSQGNRGTTTVPWNLYPTADGQVVICTSTDAQWRVLLGLAGREDLLEDQRFESASTRLLNVEEVDAIVASWTTAHETAEVLEIAAANRIPAGVVKSLAEVREERPAGAPVLVAPPHDPDAVVPGMRGQLRSLAADAAGPPLRGLRVVEIGHYTAGPYCGRILSGLGAEVVKVEPPQGEPMRHFRPKVGGDGYFFHLNNANKRALHLDLRSDEGLAEARELLAGSDVLVENMGSGSLERLGLGYEELRAANPGLVYCSVKGFGAASRRLAYDTIIQAEGGMMAATGHPGSGPVRAGISVSDALGSTLAAADVLVALRARRLAGAGSFVDVSMLDGTAWSTDRIPTAARLPLGNRDPVRAPQGIFAAGRTTIAIAVETDAQWERLAALAELAADPERASHQGRRLAAAAIDSELAAWVERIGAEQALAACRAAAVPAAPVQSVAAALEDPQTDAREMLIRADLPGTESGLQLLRLPLSMSHSRLPRPTPIVPF